jgi:predicted nucleic acid-binding protein
VFVSPVTIAELRMGLELMSDPALRLKALAAFRRLKRKPLLRIDLETGEVFGSLAAQLARAGRGHDFRVQDLWLAAQAIQRRFRFLTKNGKDFRDIPGLDLVVM